MPKLGQTLPSYGEPPINEVVIGTAFEPLPSLLIPHIGLYWAAVREQFPQCEHAPPLMTEESVDTTTGLPLPRVWFLNDRRDELIQLQNGNFFFNWRDTGQGNYPRFSAIWPKFQHVFGLWSSFVADELGTHLNVKSYELTYINVIVRGEAWSSLSDLSGLFTDFSWRPKEGRFLPAPKSVSWQASFQLPPGHGALGISVQPGRRLTDQAEVLRFELSVKGSAVEPAALDNWFTVAHEWIVKGFDDLVSRRVREDVWKRKPDIEK